MKCHVINPENFSGELKSHFLHMKLHRAVLAIIEMEKQDPDALESIAQEISDAGKILYAIADDIGGRIEHKRRLQNLALTGRA